MKREDAIYFRWWYWTLLFVFCVLWLNTVISAFIASVALGFAWFIFTGYYIYSKIAVKMVEFMLWEPRWWLAYYPDHAVGVFAKSRDDFRYEHRSEIDKVLVSTGKKKKEPWE